MFGALNFGSNKPTRTSIVDVFGSDVVTSVTTVLNIVVSTVFVVDRGTVGSSDGMLDGGGGVLDGGKGGGVLVRGGGGGVLVRGGRGGVLVEDMLDEVVVIVVGAIVSNVGSIIMGVPSPPGKVGGLVKICGGKGLAEQKQKI